MILTDDTEIIHHYFHPCSGGGFLRTVSRRFLSWIRGEQFLHGIYCGIRASSLSQQNLTLFIHTEDASGGTLRYFMKSNGPYQGRSGITEKGIR